VNRPAEAEAARPGETEAERDDRNLIELLQELRVAGLGVQVLFGFLLSIPFTTRFVKLSHAQAGGALAEHLPRVPRASAARAGNHDVDRQQLDRLRAGRRGEVQVDGQAGRVADR
jgi:Family of unknown function (DUF6328)